MDILDIAFKSATIFIALFNAYFAVKIFRLKDKKEESEKEKDRKMQLLKTLVLDHNMKNYYSIYDSIENELLNLKKANLTVPDKKGIDLTLSDFFIQLRSKFYDSLLAIDDDLYDYVKNNLDELQTSFTETIFDPGINLSHTPKYDELISQKLTTSKTEILKKLFNYRG